MAIQRYNPKNPIEITPGQYVCFEPLIMDYVASHPVKVLKVSGQRIYHRDRHDEYDEGYKALKSVRFVCDTKEEGGLLVELNQPRFKALRELEKAFKCEWDTKIDIIIEKSQQKDVDA